MLLDRLNILKTTKEEPAKMKELPARDHFNETAKVIQQLIRDEEAEDRRASPQQRLSYLKDALESSRDSDTHHRLKKEIEHLEMEIKFHEASHFIHTLPEDKAEMIMDNYRIEKSEAENDLSATNTRIKELEIQLTKIQKELGAKKYQSQKLVKMLEEAKAVPMAHKGELYADYYDDYPIFHDREKGISELRDLRIKYLKGEK